MDQPRQHPEGPAEHPREGGQGSAEQPRQLEAAVVQIHMVEQASQQHPRHDGDDVEGVLAVAGEADDGKNGPDGGPVEVAAGEHDVPGGNQPVHPHVNQHRAGAEGTHVVAGRAARGVKQHPVFFQHRPGSPGQPSQDECGAHRRQPRSQPDVIAAGPVVGRGGGQPERLEGGHQHHGHQPAGKAQAVQVHAVLHPVGVLRHRGHHKADQQPRRHPQPRVEPHRHKAHHRGQGGGAQRHVHMPGEGLLLHQGIQGRAPQDGPDIGDILAKQGKTGHQADGDHGGPVGGVVQQPEDGHADEGHKPRVDKGRPQPRYGNVVGDEHVLHGDNDAQAG